jgi:hypothetical protein
MENLAPHFGMPSLAPASTFSHRIRTVRAPICLPKTLQEAYVT